eukprot:365249-Chlamydomonas_euryale.AAC.15
MYAAQARRRAAGTREAATRAQARGTPSTSCRPGTAPQLAGTAGRVTAGTPEKTLELKHGTGGRLLSMQNLRWRSSAALAAVVLAAKQTAARLPQSTPGLARRRSPRRLSRAARTAFATRAHS